MYSVFVFVFLLINLTCSAQENYVKLEQKIAENVSDSITKEAYDELISIAASIGDFEKAKRYSKELEVFCERINDLDGLIYSYACLGYLYAQESKIDSSGFYFQKGLSIVEKLDAKTPSTLYLYNHLISFYFQKGIMDSVNILKNKILEHPCIYKEDIIGKRDIAFLLHYQGSTKEAFRVLEEVVNCSEEKELHSESSRTLDDLAKIATHIHDYESAITYTERSLQICIEMKDTLSIAANYQTLGLIHSKLGNKRESVQWLNKSISFSEQVSKNNFRTNDIIGIQYYNLSIAYQDLEQFDSAMYYIQKAINHSFGKNYNRVRFTYAMADIIIDMGRSPQIALDSILSAEKILENSPSDLESLVIGINTFKGKAYRKLRQFSKSEKFLLSAEKSALGLQNRILLIQAYEELIDLYLQQEKYKKAYTYQVLKAEEEEKERKKEKQNAILRFEIKYEIERVKQQNIVLAKERDIQQLKAKQNQLKAERNQQLVYGAVSLLVFVVIIFILLIYQFRTKAFLLTQKLKYQLLRNQMNPHFIFNSLTAIQSFVYKKNPIEAGEYIASFAELMRAILDNSDEEYVSLNKEIQWLENYLKLQLLRFDNQFDYTLKLDPEIDIEDTMIPPMLTQPFIENALEHGLKGIDYKGHLDININAHNNLLQIDILDNGIGMEESKKNNQDKEHKSRATEITQERLSFLNKKQSKNINLSIQPSDGKGTKISFAIPFISKF